MFDCKHNTVFITNKTREQRVVNIMFSMSPLRFEFLDTL